MKVDFYKQFKLLKPTAGLVEKITSPKGIRKKVSYGYAYALHTELQGVYNDKPMDLDSGVYWVLDVCKYKDELIWNHYLFYVDTTQESVVPIAEFLYQHDTNWIPDAIKPIKKVLQGHIKEIELTQFKVAPKQKTRWDSVAR